MMKKRLKKIRAFLKKRGLDGLLVVHSPNVHYLTGFPAEESWLLIGPRRVYYITDFRYMLEAKRGVKGAVVKQYTDSIYRTLFELVQKQKIKKLGFESAYMTVKRLSQLRRKSPKGVAIKATEGLIESCRETKDTDEIKLIKKALRIHAESFRYLKRVVRPGLTELDVLLKLERFVRSKGVRFSFDPIVASGPNSCLPHAKVSKRRFRRNDVVLIDWGIDYKGYKSDLTRMFFLGKISKLIRTVNDTVVDAQRKAVSLVQANVPIDQIDYQARNYLGEHNLAKYFGHALGHGVGLEIHEAPRLAHTNKERLKSGMVITVEPAVYIPEKFGVRIEDMVLVTNKGGSLLSGHIY